MGIPSDEEDFSATKFHLSMSNFILGQNPVVVTRPVEESDPTSSETSETTSGETAEVSDQEPKVILIPVERSEDSASEENSVVCENKKDKKGQMSDSIDGCDHVICEKKKKKGQNSMH